MIGLASYKVNIREGDDKGVVECTNMVSEERVLEIFGRFPFSKDFGNNCIHMGHIGRTSKFEKSDCMRYDGNNVNSMFFDCKNREHADKCLKYFKLSMN